METKKTYAANLENLRGRGFFLGAIFVLATLFVVLEYNHNTTAQGPDIALVDELSQDMELLPAVDQTEMIAAQSPTPSVKVTPKVNIVEKQESEDLEKQNKINDMRMVGETDADEKTEVNEPLSPVVVDQNDNIQPLRIVQQLPEYPGGWTTFMQWLTKNLKYPPAAQRQKVEGQVVVTFVVNRDGTLSNIRIAKSAGALLDQEALRVAHLMPKWKPGIDKGEPCRTLMAIPIIFKL